MFNGLDEIVSFNDSTVRFNLYNILIDEFAVWNRQACNCVNDINLAIHIIICYVVEKDVLGSIISLVHYKWLATWSFVSSLCPSSFVILDTH
jgi:hypothetical protein